MRRAERAPGTALGGAVLLIFVAIGLAAPGISRWATGFGPGELHSELALSPPGTRDVPQTHPSYDGDTAAFDGLDRDGDGYLRCHRAPSPGQGVPLLPLLARDWPVIHDEILRGVARIEAGGVPIRDLLRHATGPLVCPELDEPRLVWTRFHQRLFALFDGGTTEPPDGLLLPAEFPATDAALPDPALAGGGWAGPAAFQALDRDGDGRVTPPELREATRHERFVPVRLLAACDRDGDLRLSRAEFPGLPELAPFLLGTDAMGRDVLTRLAYGARVSLLVGVLATLVSLLLGVAYGAVAGAARPAVDEAMMRLVDVLYGLPFPFLVILALVAVGSHSVVHLFVLLGLVQWMTMARIVRGQVRALRRVPFVEAAEAYGAPRRTIVFGHLARNAAGPVIAYAALLVAAVIVEEAFLSFLGLGVPAGEPSWGGAIAEGARHIADFPWLIAAPSIALGLTLLGFHFLGDGLRRRLGTFS